MGAIFEKSDDFNIPPFHPILPTHTHTHTHTHTAALLGGARARTDEALLRGESAALPRHRADAFIRGGGADHSEAPFHVRRWPS